MFSLLNQAGDLRVAEQALDFALGGRVALLHLGAAHLDRFLRVRLAGTGRTADSVTARAAAQQDDDVARLRLLAHHILLRGGADHRADLHALRHITGVVQLGDLAGRQAEVPCFLN